MPDKPFISIIIPVKNFERTIEKTFEYLLAVDYPHDKWEIVIADGGSTDSTIDIIKDWQKKYSFIKLVHVPNSPSPGYARNKALDIIKGEYVFFTDADCAPCRDWINQMLEVFKRDERIGAVGGEVYTLRVDPDNLVELWCQHFRFNMVAPRYGFIKEGYFPTLPEDPDPSEVGGHRAYFFGTCNVAYRRKAMEGARFWDNPTGEDMNFSFTHQRKGWRFYFLPSAKVDHMHRANLKALRKVWVAYGRAHCPLIDKYVKKTRLEIIFQCLKSNPSIRIPFPVKGFIYLGNFHLMSLFGVGFLVSLVLSLLMTGIGLPEVLGMVFLALFAYFSFGFVRHCFAMEPKKYFFSWVKMKYLTNLSFIIGGLKDFKKYKVICIEPSF
jgi:glycosyltransferase involved in cell wall biosynthesis